MNGIFCQHSARAAQAIENVLRASCRALIRICEAKEAGTFNPETDGEAQAQAEAFALGAIHNLIHQQGYSQPHISLLVWSVCQEMAAPDPQEGT